MLFKRKDPTDLDRALTRAYTKLATHEPDSKEYAAVVIQIQKLHEMKVGNDRRVSPESWAAIGGHLAGILIIVSYERMHVVTSKALGFVPRPD